MKQENCRIRWPGTLSALLRVVPMALFSFAACCPARAQSGQAWSPLPGASVAPGFAVEQIYEVANSQGSWVSLAVDPQGRLIASDQYGGLFRITIDPAAQTTAVEPVPVNIGRAQGLLCAFGSLYVMAHAGGGQPSGLYRVRDADGDDRWDTVELLVQLDGDGEHGPHGIALTPDGQSLVFCCGNHTRLPEVQRSRVAQVWQEDLVLPRLWDASGHAVNIFAPGGYFIRTDPDGKELELLSIGFRNQYDFAFSPAGELFTFDSDMEWDVGTPWYVPTRVCHVTEGSEFGWRSGTGRWPEYFEDSLPAALDIGFGSPTGVTFGTGAAFPGRWQRTLFIADWSYGVIHAVHLRPEGASWRGERETLVTAPGLAVTDMVVRPQDGALYFAIGGRQSRSALYRVTWQGTAGGEPAPEADEAVALTAAQQERRELESLLGLGPEQAAEVLSVAAPRFGSPDRFLRFTARTAVERMPWDKWRDQALSAVGDPDCPAQVRIQWALAIARCGDDVARSRALSGLMQADWNAMSTLERLGWLRAAGLVLIRSADDMAAERQELGRWLERRHNTDPDWRCRAEQLRLLVAVGSPQAVSWGMEMLEQGETQEQQIHCFYCLANATGGWTPELQDRYFRWYLGTGHMRGGNSFAKFLSNIRDVAISHLDAPAKTRLASLIAGQPEPATPAPPVEAREFVRKWSMDDFSGIAARDLEGRDLERGARMFVAGQCFQCHRVGDSGGSVGPDLTAAGRRFSPRDLVETLIVPGKEVSDQYRATVFLLEDGRTITGRIANLNRDRLYIQTNMLDPGNFTQISTSDIVEQRPATVSMMPDGLLDTMSREEILDLLGWMRAAGEAALQRQGR